MEFDLMTRGKVTQKFAQSYQEAPSKKAKSLILNENSPTSHEDLRLYDRPRTGPREANHAA